MKNIKIPLANNLQESYADLIQDLEWTIGEYSYEYEVKIEEENEDYAQLGVVVTDTYHREEIKFILDFRIYSDKPTTINRYEDVWDEENREKIWQMLFFQSNR